MIFGSVCSGIEAASVAWHPLGWRCAFMSEIEAFPRAVLAHHYPETALHGDFTTIRAGQYGPVDVLVGGTPCQSFSVAGLRGGLADGRGNLALEYLRLAERLHPRWMVWENVPGVLSSGGGRDFGSFVGGLVELGYGFAYRVLDAQYFGLAQRRKRVFVVGCLGDWRRAAAVLFEPASLRGDSAPGREARERATGSLAARTQSGGGLGTDFDCDGGLITETVRSHPRPGSNSVGNIAYALNAHGGAGRMDGESETFIATTAPALTRFGGRLNGQSGREDQFVTHSLRADGFDASEDGTGRGTPLVAIPLLEIGKGSSSRGVGPNGAGFGEDGDPMFTLQAGAQHGVAFHQNQRAEVTTNETAGALNSGGGKPGQGYPAVFFQTSQSGVRDHDTHATLDANNGSRRHNGAIVGSAVRRLTPRECERLQGFPDDYTLIPWRGKPAADGPRYRALGNSMAVPVMSWIGQRIAKVEQSP